MCVDCGGPCWQKLKQLEMFICSEGYRFNNNNNKKIGLGKKKKTILIFWTCHWRSSLMLWEELCRQFISNHFWNRTDFEAVLLKLWSVLGKCMFTQSSHFVLLTFFGKVICHYGVSSHTTDNSWSRWTAVKAALGSLLTICTRCPIGPGWERAPGIICGRGEAVLPPQVLQFHPCPLK